VNLERLGAMVRKEFVQMRRDPTTLRLMLAVPVMQLLIFGFAVRTDVRNLPTVIFDQSRTQESRSFVQSLVATDNFVVKSEVHSYAEALEAVDAGRARAAVVFPPDYARRLKRGDTAPIQVLVDASDPTASQSAIAAAQLVGQITNRKLVTLRAGAAGNPTTQLPVDVRVRPLYNPALANAIFIVPGLIGMILSNTLIIITALTIVRERETGTLEQLIVTPLAKWEIMLGKIAPYVLVGYMQLTIVLVVGYFVFHVPIRGPLLALYGASFLFIVASLGLGLFVSTLGRNQAQVMQTAFLFLLPNILLSGFMWPREAMPVAARYVGIFLPLTHYLRLVRGIVLKGNGLTELWPQLLALAVFAFLFFMFSTWRFSKTLE
jgi:ABC-2 type transport system permease protein